MEVSRAGKVGCVVPGAESYQSEQGSVYAPGISAETVGSKALFLGMVTLPPEGRTKAHIHEHHESAFYLLRGDEVEFWTGDDLAHREVARPGDYLFIPAKVPHVAVNRSKTTPAFSLARAMNPPRRRAWSCFRSSMRRYLSAARKGLSLLAEASPIVFCHVHVRLLGCETVVAGKCD
jgi:uncharacterized RmlC-like cupin family protein